MLKQFRERFRLLMLLSAHFSSFPGTSPNNYHSGALHFTFAFSPGHKTRLTNKRYLCYKTFRGVGEAEAFLKTSEALLFNACLMYYARRDGERKENARERNEIKIRFHKES